jgi:O-antigen/teichoic acid export membrane protein
MASTLAVTLADRRARPRLAHPLRASFATSAVGQGLTAGAAIVLARVLGAEARGALAAIVLWPMVLVVVGSLGMGEAMTYHAARGTRPTRALVGTGIAIALAEAAVLGAIAAVVLPFALHSFDPHVRVLAYVYAATIPLSLVAAYLTNVLQGLNRFTAFQVLRVLQLIAAAGGFAALAVVGQLSLTSAMTAYFVAQGVTVLAALLLLRRELAAGLRFEAKLARRLLSYGIRSHASSVASLLNERLDQVVISLVLAPTQLGLYVVAVTTTAATGLVGASVAMIATPVIARTDDSDERAAKAARYTKLTLVVSAATAVPLLVAVPRVIQFCFGHEFLGAGHVARLLLLASIVYGASRVLGGTLRALGRPLDAAACDSLALVVTLVGLAALLPTIGILGAGVASLAAYGTALVAMLRRTSKALGVPVSFLLLPAWLRRAGEALA